MTRSRSRSSFASTLTTVRRGDKVEHLYLSAAASNPRMKWTQRGSTLEYTRELPHSIHMLARAVLEVKLLVLRAR